MTETKELLTDMDLLKLRNAELHHGVNQLKVYEKHYLEVIRGLQIEKDMAEDRYYKLLTYRQDAKETKNITLHGWVECTACGERITLKNFKEKEVK